MTALFHAQAALVELRKSDAYKRWGKVPASHIAKCEVELLATIDELTAPVPSVNPFADFVGVCAYRTADFDLISSLGVRHARMDNPSAATIALAKTKSIELLPIAAYNPWTDLRPGGTDDKTPPTNVALWSARMVEQWRTMDNPPKVFEVWNEPWLSNFWKPKPAPAAYFDLVAAFTSAVWAVWPLAKVLVSADTKGTAAIDWRKGLLAADPGKLLADPRIRPTTHNYVEGRTPTQRTTEPCSWDLDRYRCAYDDFKAHGHVDPKVWVTEFGWQAQIVGEANQAAYTTEAYQSLLASGIVERAYAYMLQSNHADDDQGGYDWLRPGGSAQRPVCAAVRALT